jgi:hypothetical protein
MKQLMTALMLVGLFGCAGQSLVDFKYELQSRVAKGELTPYAANYMLEKELENRVASERQAQNWANAMVYMGNSMQQQGYQQQQQQNQQLQQHNNERLLYELQQQRIQPMFH